MGNFWATCTRGSKKPKDTKSPWRIGQYVMEAISEFVVGWTTMFFMPLIITLYVGVSSSDASVVDTNLRSIMLILSFIFAIFTVMGIKGSFSTQLPNVWGNPYWSVLSCVVALIDARARVKDLWIVVLPFIYSGCVIAGGFAGAAQFFATFPTSIIPTFLQAIGANMVQLNSLWALLVSSTCYLLLSHIVVFTCNGTRDGNSSLWPLTFMTFVIGLIQFISIRQLPNFVFNLSYAYLNGNYSLLWIDVVGYCIGASVTALLYFFMWQIRFEPDQSLRTRNFHIPWDFSSPFWKGFKKSKNHTYHKKNVSNSGSQSRFDHPEMSTLMNDSESGPDDAKKHHSGSSNKHD